MVFFQKVSGGTLCPQLLRYFIRDRSAKTVSTQVIWAFSLCSANLLHVACGHVLNAGLRLATSIKPQTLQSVKRLILAEVLGQFAVDQDISTCAVHAKEWWT